jgi:hypothetical protein
MLAVFYFRFASGTNQLQKPKPVAGEYLRASWNRFSREVTGKAWAFKQFVSHGIVTVPGRTLAARPQTKRVGGSMPERIKRSGVVGRQRGGSGDGTQWTAPRNSSGLGRKKDWKHMTRYRAHPRNGGFEKWPSRSRGLIGGSINSADSVWLVDGKQKRTMRLFFVNFRVFCNDVR